jgi:hypothetical protein
MPKMAEKEIEAKDAEVQVEAPKPAEEEVIPEQKPQESNEAYEQRLAKLEEDLKTSNSRWQSAQGIINKQKEEIESLRDNQELWKMLIGMRAQEMGSSEAEAEQDLQKKKPDFMQQANMVEKQLEAKRIQSKINSYRSTVEDELGLKPGDDDYETIQAFVIAGKFDRADKKIAAIKASKSDNPEPKKGETEAERIERLAEEKKNAYLKEKGLLTSEGGEPSAPASKGFAKIEQDYADGVISTAEYEEAMRKYGKK